MWKTFRIAVALTGVLLSIAVNDSTAAEFYVDAGGVHGGATYEPWADQDLKAVLSANYDYTEAQAGANGQLMWSAQGSSMAAVYGSDSSVSSRADTLLRQHGIEPMADVMASINLSCGPNTGCSSVDQWGTDGWAQATVTHRVMQRAVVATLPPDVQAFLNTFATIPVKIAYHCSITLTREPNPSPTRGYKYVYARLTVNNTPLDKQCTLSVPSLDGIYNTNITPSKVDQTVTFSIRVEARGSAIAYKETSYAIYHAEIQVVADPYVYIDPDWEYAPYFMVQAESVLHPGEWVEVTRAWRQDAPIANAGPDQSVDVGTPVTLNGSGSSDPTPGPLPLRYTWSQTGGPAVMLNDADTPTPSFTPQQLGIYTFDLVVNDGMTDSKSDSVMVATYPIIYVVGQNGLCGNRSPCRTSIANGIEYGQSSAILRVTQETYNENVDLLPEFCV